MARLSILVQGVGHCSLSGAWDSVFFARLSTQPDMLVETMSEAYSSSEPFSCGGGVKTHYDPERWESFRREIDVSWMRIHSLKWVEEKGWRGGDRLWRVKGKWSRERSVYADAASGRIELDIHLHAAPERLDNEKTKDWIVARISKWMKSVPKESRLPEKRRLGITRPLQT